MTKRHRTGIATGAFLLGALATAAPASKSYPAAPGLRLQEPARPLRYRAALRVDPTRDTFSAEIDIDLELRASLPVLWLNANDLTVEAVEAKTAEAVVKGEVGATPKDFLGITFAHPLAPGTATVHLRYTGTLSSKDSTGASRQKEGDDWYVFTQFEPLDARRVFPCFDEPAYKVPWSLTLTVPEGNRAFANTPVKGERLRDGWRTYEFAETRPLPSYLVAWAVGPFDVVDAGRSRKSGTPLRIVTPRGWGYRAHYASEVSAEILSRLEDYFGSDYPFEKLDCIGVPLFGGAMENPGLITFGARIILRRPDEETVEMRRTYANVATHEMAHLWFGDLVTMAWWDDLWLNEAFATWMTPRIVEGWQPAWSAPEERVRTRGAAMAADSLVTARKIRQPIVNDDDIQTAFDGITYAKGASVIHMFERWVGPDAFQKGVRRYMHDHAYGNATAADFFAAIAAESPQDVAGAFSTFVDQPGVPLVSMSLSCSPGERLPPGQTPTLLLKQERYLPAGSEGDGKRRDPLWRIPVCVNWSAAGAAAEACTLLTDRKGSLPLAGALACPDWINPNTAAAGYYESALPSAWLRPLLADGAPHLTVPERLGALQDVGGLTRAGRLSYADALAWMPRLAQDPNRNVVEATLGFTASLRDSELVGDAEADTYARFIRTTYGARAHALGWRPPSEEPEDAKLLRSRVVVTVAEDGEDPELVAEARKMAAARLEDRNAVPPEIVDDVLRVSARYGDRAHYDRLLATAQKEGDSQERRRYLQALGQFRDPELVRESLSLLLGDSFEPREALSLLWGATRWPATRAVAWDFVKKSFDPLVAKLPRDSAAYLPWVAARLCDDAHRQEVASFFKERAPRFVGGPRELSQTLESMRLCTAFKREQAPSVAAFLADFERMTAK